MSRFTHKINFRSSPETKATHIFDGESETPLCKELGTYRQEDDSHRDNMCPKCVWSLAEKAPVTLTGKWAKYNQQETE